VQGPPGLDSRASWTASELPTPYSDTCFYGRLRHGTNASLVSTVNPLSPEPLELRVQCSRPSAWGNLWSDAASPGFEANIRGLLLPRRRSEGIVLRLPSSQGWLSVMGIGGRVRRVPKSWSWQAPPRNCWPNSAQPYVFSPADGST
jgi:hypothetical protein